MLNSDSEQSQVNEPHQFCIIFEKNKPEENNKKYGMDEKYMCGLYNGGHFG